MGNPDRPELGEELTNSFCRTDPEIAAHFARVTFLSDNRADLARVTTPTLVLQCARGRDRAAVRRRVRAPRGRRQPARDPRRDGPLPEPERARGDDRRDRGVPLAVAVVAERRDAEDLYENAPCGYLSTRPDGTIVKVNQTLPDLDRVPPRGPGRRAPLPRPADAPAGGSTTRRTIAPLLQMQGAVREIALDIVCADGRRLPVLVNAVLKRDADGRAAARSASRSSTPPTAASTSASCCGHATASATRASGPSGCSASRPCSPAPPSPGRSGAGWCASSRPARARTAGCWPSASGARSWLASATRRTRSARRPPSPSSATAT